MGDLWQYSFIQRAFIAGSFTAVSCSLLGLFLVLRRMSFIGDGLSHLSFGAIALGLFFGIYPFYAAVPLVILGSLLILKISEKARIYEDAAIGIVSTMGIAGGVILASVSAGFNVDLFSYLFGNILAIGTHELIFSVVFSLAVLLVIYFFYWDLFSVIFDEEYARISGIKIDFINSLLTVLTAVVVLLAVKVVGTLLASALLILPAVGALQICHQFKRALLVSAIFSFLSVVAGIFVSFSFDLPTGAIIVVINFLFFILAFVLRKIGW